MEKPYIYRFTGNPLVDAGIASLCALSGKSDPLEINADDLVYAAEYISQIYPRWQKFQNLFTRNCLLLHPVIKDRDKRYKSYIENLSKKILESSGTGNCAICGMRDADTLVLRHQHPLTGSGDLVNYFSFFEPGLPICNACVFALQFVPIYLISNNGILFLAHSHSKRVMLDLAKYSLVYIRGLHAAGENLTYHRPFPFPKNDMYQCIVKLARFLISKAESQYGPVVIRLYSFINSGQRNDLDFIDLPANVFEFIERSYVGGLGRSIDQLFGESGRGIYRRLVEGESIKHLFINYKERRIRGGWNLFELYLTEVESMDKSRLEVIKKVGKNLYDYLKAEGFKKLKDLEGADKYGEFRMILTRAQKDRLIWEIDDEALLFPQDKEGAIMWRETQSILLAYIYEQIHKNKDEVK